MPKRKLPMIGLENKAIRTIGILAFFSLSLPACAQNRNLGINEVCFTRVNELDYIELTCYDKDGNEYRRIDRTADKYTCFNAKEASKLSAFVDKCLKEGIKP